jgi:predicted dienelactone hydrolase
MVWVRPLVIVFSATALLASAVHAANPSPSGPGAHLVGHFQTKVTDTARGNRVLPLHVWHPADSASWSDEEDFSFFALFLKIGITSSVAKDGVDAKSGTFPLLIFSHGYGGIPTQSLQLMEHLASHGFVVVSISHTGNVQDDMTSTNPLADRFPDVVFTIDQVGVMNDTPTSPLYQHVDNQNVGVIGHSFGGMTAELMATGYGSSPPDSRVKAIMPIAAASRPISDARLQSITIPTLLLVGTLDDLQAETARGFELISSGPNLFRADLVGATHTHFANVCDIGNTLIDAGVGIRTWRVIGAGALIEPYKTTCLPPAFPIAKALRIQNQYAVAHFRTYLLGEQEYRKYLTTGYAKQYEPDVKFYVGAAAETAARRAAQ